MAHVAMMSVDKGFSELYKLIVVNYLTEKFSLYCVHFLPDSITCQPGQKGLLCVFLFQIVVSSVHSHRSL